ncbi:hypothetical protein ACP3P8_18550, partial [Pseudomonas aeruginosa]
ASSRRGRACWKAPKASTIAQGAPHPRRHPPPWCCNAGHGRREISEAVARQIATLDYAPPFQMGHPLPFELAARLAEIARRA